MQDNANQMRPNEMMRKKYVKTEKETGPAANEKEFKKNDDAIRNMTHDIIEFISHRKQTMIFP
jgi:hypothetical protein